MTQYQERLINDARECLNTLGMLPVDVYMELNNEGIDADAIERDYHEEN